MSQTQKTLQLKNQIKYLASNKGLNLNELVEELHNKYNRCNNPSSFSTRLKRGSLSVLELIEALEILDCELTINDKTKM